VVPQSGSIREENSRKLLRKLSPKIWDITNPWLHKDGNKSE
jgi:hypothetical protein